MRTSLESKRMGRPVDEDDTPEGLNNRNRNEKGHPDYRMLPKLNNKDHNDPSQDIDPLFDD